MAENPISNTQGIDQNQQATENTAVPMTCTVWPSCLGRTFKLCLCTATGPELDTNERERMLIQITIDALLCRDGLESAERQNMPTERYDECWTFISEAKKTIDDKESYIEFLKLFECHAQNRLERDLIVDCAAAFIGHNTNLMATLQTMIEHESGDVGLATRFWQRSMVSCYDPIGQIAQNDVVAGAGPAELAQTMDDNLCDENERAQEGLPSDEYCDKESSALSDEFELIDDGTDLQGNASEETGLKESTCIAKMFEYVKKTLSRKAGRTKEIVNISAPIPIMVPTIDPITGTTFRSPFVAMPNGLYAINGLASTPIVYSHRALWDPTTCSWVFMHEETMVVSMDWPSNAKVKPEKGVVIGTKEGLDKHGKKIVERVILWPTETGRANPNHVDPFVDAPPPSADLTTLSVLNGEAGPAVGVDTRARRRPKKSSNRK